MIPSTVFNITNYGAIGDGVKDNTTNIQNCINAASTAGGGIVEVPAGTFLSGPITLYSEINLQVDTNGMLQMLPLYTYPGGTTNAQQFIYCNTIHDLEISGFGKIDGQGAAWWAYNATNSSIVRPLMLQLYTVNRLFIHDVTFENPPYHHCGLRDNGGNITISNLTVNTPANTPNTDGLNFVGTNCIIENCHISDGDDNIAMGSTGPLRDLLITNCIFGTGHGLSFGSGTVDGISNVIAINCQFNGTTYGIRMKSDTNGGGVVTDIHYYNLTMTNMIDGAISIYSYYNEIGTPTRITPANAASEAVDPVTPNSLTPVWRDITISNLTAYVGSSGNAGIIWARTELPATNIVMDHVTINASQPFDVYNAQGIKFLNSTINDGSTTFALWNANVIVSNTAPVTNLLTFTGLGGNTNDSLALYNASASMTSTDLFGINPLTLSSSSLTNSGNLTLRTNVAADFALGTSKATVNVGGNLSLNGTINVTNGVGFTTTTYTLFTYTGSASGQPVLGTMPLGFGGTLSIGSGQVKLTVTTGGVIITPTTTSVQSSANPTTYGEGVTFTATVTPVPTNGESVTFMDGGTVLGSGALTGGQASYTTSGTQLVAGSHSITAEYGGDGAFAASVSPALVQMVSPPSGTVLDDTFGSSTVDSTSPSPPTMTSASYQVLSGKSLSPLPSIGSGGLSFGIAATSSGVVELQGLFSTAPIALLSPGDFVQLTVTFTDTAGILNQTGNWDFGLYNSGGVAPVAGGLNGSLNTGSTTAETGDAQDWQGYVAQIGFTGATSGFYDRQSQSAGTANNDQDLVTSGTSSSYKTPEANSIGTASTTPSTTLTVGNQYTEMLTYTLTSSNTLQLQSELYTGANSSGTLMSTMTADTGANPLTTSFDGLAFGWRAEGGAASTMTVNSITVTSQTTPVGQSTAPIVSCTFTNPILTLSWPPNYLGWLVQSNAGTLASPNWITVPGTGASTNFPVNIGTAPSGLFRLVSP